MSHMTLRIQTRIFWRCKCIMNKLISIVFFFITINCNAQIFKYVSPDGDDNNPGTLQKPWKSFSKAATSATAGCIVLFADGLYYEKDPVNILNSGKADARIVFKSQNKNKAKILFSKKSKLEEKINIINKEYISIIDFEISQEGRAKISDKSKTRDILIACRNSNHCEILGNIVHNAFEDLIKVNASDNIKVQNNVLFNAHHEGIDFVNNSNSEISYNTISEIERVSILVKGGSRNIMIADNHIYNSDVQLTNSAISIGGMTDKVSTYDNSSKGFEAYSVLCIDNLIESKKPSLIRNGISFMGATNSYCFNNTIIAPLRGFYFITVNGMKN